MSAEKYGLAVCFGPRVILHKVDRRLSPELIGNDKVDITSDFFKTLCTYAQSYFETYNCDEIVLSDVETKKEALTIQAPKNITSGVEEVTDYVLEEEELNVIVCFEARTGHSFKYGPFIKDKKSFIEVVNRNLEEYESRVSESIQFVKSNLLLINKYIETTQQ